MRLAFEGVSARGRPGVLVAAFLTACLAGLGLGLVLQGDGEARRAQRAGVPAPVTTDLPTQQLPATPALRLGSSPVAAPVQSRPAPAEPGTATPTPTPPAQQQQQQQAPPSGSGGPGLSVQDEAVASP